MSFINSTLNVSDYTLTTYLWDTKAPKAEILILHGMSEHAARYNHFAEYLVNAGFRVRAHDHRGHGKSVQNIEGLGHLGTKGWNSCIDDIHCHVEKIKSEAPELPLFILGHSMGSFMLQNYIIKFGNGLDGVILSGSNGKPPRIAHLGRLIARFERLRKGRRAFSTLMDKLAFGEFAKQFKPIRTGFDWLSRDESIVDAYISDVYCGFKCDNQFWVEFLDALNKINDGYQISKISKTLPILIFSGATDPVGHQTIGLKKLIASYTKAGIKNIRYTFYPYGRHEMLNEINKEEVYKDILNWLDIQLSSVAL